MAGNYNLPEDSDLRGIIRDLQKRLDILERGTRAPATSIDNGALIVKKGNFPIGVLGDLGMAGFDLQRPDGTAQMGFLFYRDDGSIAFSLYDDQPNDGVGYNQFVGLWDRRQRPILMEDFRLGYGLARPFMPGATIYSPDVNVWPATQSGAFVSAHECYMFFENPVLYCDFVMWCDAGTSGEARLMIDGAQYGPTIAGGAGYSIFNQKLILPASMVAVDWKRVYIEQRRTGGAGNVRTAFRILYGTQSGGIVGI